MVERFAKSDARIHHDPVLRHPVVDCETCPFGQKLSDLPDHVVVAGRVLHGFRSPLHVHQRKTGTCLRHDIDHGAVTAQGRDVVDHDGACVNRGPGHLRFGGIDGNGDGHGLRHRRDDRHKPTAFFLLINRERTRSGRFGADIQQIGPFFDQTQRMGNRTLRIAKPPPVKKGVRGYVDNPHQQGAIESKTLSFELELHRCDHALHNTAALYPLWESRYNPVSRLTRVP